MELNEIVKLIKQKKELIGIEDGVVIQLLEKRLKSGRLNFSQMKDKDIKILVKEVRSELRLLSGSFRNKDMRTEEMLASKGYDNLLRSHSSSNERLDFYPTLKEKFIALKIKSFLDLGCGLNPLALADKNTNYFASDINKEDVRILNSFFQDNGINGKAEVFDIRDIASDKEINLPNTDITLVLKVFDAIEKKGHKMAEKIISKLHSPYILVSFSTITLSGRRMNFPNRGWIERMLKRLQKKFERFSSDNEVYYLIYNS